MLIFVRQFVFRFRTHVVVTTECTTEGVHTLTCCTHIFLHIACAQSHLYIFMRVHIHAWLKVMKKVFVACVSSHVSPVFAVPAHSLRHHVPVNLLAELSRPESAGHRDVWLPGQVRCKHTQDGR